MPESDELFDDPVLSQSIRSMPAIEVPSAFLPNVMYQVFESHHRDKINLVAFAALSLTLLLLSAGLFVLDVQDYATAHQLPGFSQALSEKMNQLLNYFDGFFSAFTGILFASVRIVSGAMGMIPSWLQILIIIAIPLAAWLLKKVFARKLI